jgi:hypothetical protein
VIVDLALSVVLIVFGDMARRRGKRIEPRLIQKSGGLPSTTILRHSDTTFDAKTKARMYAFIASKINEPAPTPEQEMADPAAADTYYSPAGTWLRENTRNTKKIPDPFRGKHHLRLSS